MISSSVFYKIAKFGAEALIVILTIVFYWLLFFADFSLSESVIHSDKIVESIKIIIIQYLTRNSLVLIYFFIYRKQLYFGK